MKLFAASGLDLNPLREGAVSRDFKPVTLKASLSGTVKNQLREIDTNNVIAKIEGSDPRLRNEYVVYSAHWDQEPVMALDELLGERAFGANKIRSAFV